MIKHVDYNGLVNYKLGDRLQNIRSLSNALFTSNYVLLLVCDFHKSRLVHTVIADNHDHI